MAPTSGESSPASTTKTPAHTLIRVRNNQRRHRERRRQYISWLEGQLGETQTLLADARAQIAALEVQLKEVQHKDNVIHPRGETTTTHANAPGAGRRQETILSESSEHLSADSGPDVGTAQRVNAVTTRASQRPQPMPVSPGQHLSLVSAASPQRTATMNVYSQEPLNSTPPVSPRCCTQEDRQPTTVLDYLAENMALSAPEPGEFESTTLCREAYVLISQQNYRGLDADAIRRWLEHGFRRGMPQDGGCRVATVLLFSLLDFITHT